MLRELLDELRSVLAGRPVIDGAIPVVAFGVLAGWSIPWAAGIAVGVGILLLVRRRITGGSGSWALGGIAGVAIGAALAVWSGAAGGFFLPGVIRGGAVAVVGLVSLLLPLPMVAWTSIVFRRWPVGWYRHPRVRPAYAETTWLWVAFFAGRALAQYLALDADAVAQTILAVVGGWPATIVLLVATYVYGTWRLRRLAGPSVDEWEAKAEPPWEGQRRGF